LGRIDWGGQRGKGKKKEDGGGIRVSKAIPGESDPNGVRGKRTGGKGGLEESSENKKNNVEWGNLDDTTRWGGKKKKEILGKKKVMRHVRKSEAF